MERLRKQEEKLKLMKDKLKVYQRQLVHNKQQGKPTDNLDKRIRLHREAIARRKQHIKELKTKHEEQIHKSIQRLESRRQRDKAAIDKLKLKVETQKETRDYNLSTSLKSYINPKIYYEWGKKVDYDWKMYYPKALQKKFSWVETDRTLTQKS